MARKKEEQVKNPKRPKSSNKDIDNLIKIAASQGWRFKGAGKGGHIKCFSPDNKTVVVLPVSTSSPKSVKNAKSFFKKGGLKFE